MFLGAGRVGVDGDHFLVHVLPQLLLLLRLGKFLLEVGANADLAVHDRRQSERGKAVLQLNEFCTEKNYTVHYHKKC